MSLKTATARYVDLAFKAAESLAINATYKVCTGQSHDPQTLELIQNFAEISAVCIFTKYRRREIDFAAGEIMMTDKKILMPVKYIAGTQPFSGEIVTGAQIVVESNAYEIIDVGKDPTESLYTIQGRAI
jgi:hypothetical protein